MKIKSYLFFLFSVTVFAIASVILDIFNYNPYQSGVGVFVNFYFSFFLSITGVLSIIIFFLKIKLKKGEWSQVHLLPSIRQASLVALSLTVLLVLKGLKLLDWWVAGPLVVSIILLELFFQTVSPTIKNQKKIDRIDVKI